MIEVDDHEVGSHRSDDRPHRLSRACMFGLGDEVGRITRGLTNWRTIRYRAQRVTLSGWCQKESIQINPAATNQ
ncbi:hypothetical protein A5766_09540 [Gordonia sp. 852002-51296_SCH5728562-b]|nr:hypothetical protein A5766_09540 [Gordonia sp. 852002-51296_SCH5728562-b]